MGDKAKGRSKNLAKPKPREESIGAKTRVLGPRHSSSGPSEKAVERAKNRRRR